MEEKKDPPSWNHNQDMNLEGIKKILEQMKAGAEKALDGVEDAIRSKQSIIDGIKGKK